MDEFRLPSGYRRATFARLYSELELYRALACTYAKPLFSWRRALSRSHDGRTLHDFARHTPQNAERVHRELAREQFTFRPALPLHYNFNGKHRTIYLFPWEERIVDLMLYRTLSRYFHGALSPHAYAYRWRFGGVDACQHRLSCSLRAMPKPVYGLRRDVSNYFPSVDQDILLDALSRWVDPADYLFRLLEQRVRFAVVEGEEDEPRSVRRGIPFGSAIACFFANVYLTPLDRRMERIEGLAYFRYADDVATFTSAPKTALAAARCFATTMHELKLQTKPKHHLDFCLGGEGKPGCAESRAFTPIRGLRYLGLEHTPDAGVRLPRDKFRKLRNLFRFAFRRARRALHRARTPEQRAQICVNVAREVVGRTFRSVAIIDYYLKHVTDEEQLRLLDRWLAEEVLATAFQNGHKKGNFRRLSFKSLREMGLPSLRHRRRLLVHGHLDSSFFRMCTDRRVDRARRRPPGREAFSPRLEAAAQKSS